MTLPPIERVWHMQETSTVSLASLPSQALSPETLITLLSQASPLSQASLWERCFLMSEVPLYKSLEARVALHLAPFHQRTEVNYTEAIQNTELP